MKTSVLRPVRLLLSVTLFVALFLSACKSLPGPWGKGFMIEIEPVSGAASQLQGLYIIVSPERDVREALSSSDLSLLLEETKIENIYTSFRQYAPTEDGGWKEEFNARPSSLVTYNVKDSEIEIEVAKTISGSQGIRYSVVILGFFGRSGFKQVTVTQTMIDADENQRVIIEANDFSLTGA